MKKIGIFLLLLCFACDSDSVGPAGSSDFGIYLLKDKSASLYHMENIDINKLELEDAPWIGADDIEMYDYSSHCIYLKKTKADFFTQQVGISYNAQPFVVCANNRRCYIGAFYSMTSSIAISTPSIEDIADFIYPDDVIPIFSGFIGDHDQRNNFNIEIGLEQFGILHKGLVFELHSVEILDNGEIATIRYSYGIKNNDEDDLYILDPAKMGVNLFHYFTNGVVFRGNNIEYIAEYKTKETPDPWDSWKPEWFSKIRSGEVITKIITLKGYPHLPPGNYECFMFFNSPKNIAKEDRILSDGRYWLGYIQSPNFEMTIQ
ncbi:MAG: hypothetical protein V1720_07610 [bacterium]